MAWRRHVLFNTLAFMSAMVWWSSPHGRVRFPQSSHLQSGDVVFMTGISFRSGLVRLLEGYAGDYSHVGLVVIEGGHPFVIHADPSLNSAHDRVQKEPWGAIITPTRISGAAVFRLAASYPNTAPGKAASVALQFAREALSFDHDFDLRTPEKLYCTELVWRAYMAAQIDLRGSSFGSDRKYLLPSDLINSGFLRKLDEVPNQLLRGSESSAPIKGAQPRDSSFRHRAEPA